MLSRFVAKLFPMSLLLVSFSTFSAHAIIDGNVKPKTDFEIICESLLDPHKALVNLLSEVTDDQALLLMKANYSELLTWLTQKADATAEGSTTAAKGAYGPNKDQTPSQFLFGQQITEVDRTAVGFLAIKWLLADDYAAFTHNQPPPVKLSKESFKQLRSYVKDVLKTTADVDAMIVMLLTNDLGKVKRYHDITEKAAGRAIVDHDQVLFTGFTEAAELSPNFMRLPQLQKDWIVDGLLMGSGLNVGQFAQAENLPASLNAVKVLTGKPEAFEFKFIELLLDVAGAQGHMDSGGAKVMMEPVFRNFMLARQALQEVIAGKSTREAYDQILIEKNKFLVSQGARYFDVNDKKDRAILRLLTMSRTTTLEQAEMVESVFANLPRNAKEILIAELNVDAVEDGWGILPYYAPAFIVNAVGSLSKTPHGAKVAFRTVFLSLARVLQEGRILLKGRTGNDVLTVNVEKLAKYVLTDEYKADPDSLMNQEYDLFQNGTDENQFGVNLSPLNKIDPTKFPRLRDLSGFKDKNIVVVGIGGGSDVIQAAILGQMLKSAGANVVGAFSVRTSKIGSQGAGTRDQLGQPRQFQNVQELRDNVFQVNSQSTGSGRMLEPLIADEFPHSYIVLDDGVASLEKRLKDALSLRGFENVDTVMLVDTGGDSLYPVHTEGHSASKTTPDQDLRVLKAAGYLSRVRYGKIQYLSVIVAAGVDSPANAEEVLLKAKADYFLPSLDQKQDILEQYRAWGMDGSHPDRYGKTPLAWQAALNYQLGVTVVKLPPRVVLDHANPWNPFVRVPVKGIFIMELEEHIKALLTP